MKYLFFILLIVKINAYAQSEYTRSWIDAELKHTDTKGNVVKFINSLPKGGGLVHKNGEKYSYVVFWTRIYNQSATLLELNVRFPEVTFFKSPDSYIQILLPKDTMHMDKVQSYDYGLTNLQSLLNDESNRLNVLQKKIKPNEECIFYTAVFIHIEGWGPARAKFEIKNQDLFYKISMRSDTTTIPCGSFYFNNN